jgi:SSS family solute:Na+ symporter
MYVSRTKEVTVESYFFANRNIHWLLIGISFSTTCIFSPYFFGIGSPVSSSGVAIIYGLVSAVMLIVLGWYIAPLYLRTRINTLPEYFEKRFNRTCRYFLSSLYIFYNIFIRLMIILVAGNIFINTVTGADAYSSLLFFLIVTGIYIIIGGLRAEIYVNVIQALFIALGIAGFFIWISGHGIDFEIYKNASLSFFNSDSEFTWTGLIIGLPIIGFWFWCVDQFMIQKVLSIRNSFSVRKASLATILFQIIPILIFVLPGIVVVTLFPGTPSKEALNALFSNNYLPESLQGGLIIAIAAILMASFAGLFNSTSHLITFDFYRNLKPKASDRKLVLVGRLTTMVLLLCSITLIPVSQAIDFSLCMKLFNVFAYFSSIVAAIFLLSLISKRINSISVITTLSVGTIIILLKASFEIFFSDYTIGNSLMNLFSGLGFLDFSIFIFFLSVLSLILFSKVEGLQNLVKILKQVIAKLKWNLNKTVF